MASIILPQVLCTIPRNSRQCEKASQKLGAFSAAVSGKTLSFSSRVSLSLSSRISYRKLNGDLSFVLRAEAKSDEAEEAEEAEEKQLGMPRIKFGDVMGILNKRAIEESEEVRPRPDIRTGDVVEIKMEFSDKWRYSIPAPQLGKAGRGRTVGKNAGKENKKEYKIYKGIVMSRQNAGVHTTIRIRRIIAGVGVEIVFPLYSPNIKEIKVLHHRKVRRARLYYLRDKLPRFSTVK